MASVPHVLCVEGSLGGVSGGSLTGMVALVGGVDRTRFRPSVVLLEPKAIEAELRAAGIAVHVIGPVAPRLRPQGFRAARVVLRAVELARVIVPRVRRLRALFRRERADLVYAANGFNRNVDAVLAAALCRIPMVVHVKGFRHLGPLERVASRTVETGIGMTDDIVAFARGQGARPRRFVTIHDGVDVGRFTAGGGTAVRDAFRIPRDAPVVGLVGHVQEWKGQLLVLDAVARARRAVPDLRCLLVGGVHRDGTDYAARVRARAAEPDLDRCAILTGERGDVPACLDAMDVALHASIAPEPFGRVLIEAMAAGRPVIAPREGGPVAIVADGQTGVLVPPRDPAALAEAIVGLCVDRDRRLAMGSAARRRAESCFSLERHVAAVADVWDESRGRPSRAA